MDEQQTSHRYLSSPPAAACCPLHESLVQSVLLDENNFEEVENRNTLFGVFLTSPAPSVITGNVIGVPTQDGSGCSHFSSVSKNADNEPQTTTESSGKLGRCILVLLLHAVFVFAVFLAFLIGHWLSSHAVANQQSKLKSTEEPTQNLTSSSPTAIVPHHNATLIPLTRSASTSSTTSGANRKRKNPPTAWNVDADWIRNTLFPSLHYDTPHTSLAPRRRLRGRTGMSLSTFRLPDVVLPLHYDLRLDIRHVESKGELHGNVTILLEGRPPAVDAPLQLVFHAAASVHILRVRLKHNGRPVTIMAVRQESDAALVRLALRERLKSGLYVLDVEFRTDVCRARQKSEPSPAVHCVWAAAQDGNRTALLEHWVTRFEPTNGRAFLPCWDEPRFRATWNLSVQHDRYDSSSFFIVTSGRRVGEERRNRSKLELFEIDRPIPTHLFAMAVGRFSRIESTTSRGVKISVFCQSRDTLNLRFFANAAPLLLDRMERQLEVGYRHDKLDLLSIDGFPGRGAASSSIVTFDRLSIIATVIKNDETENNETESGGKVVDRLAEEWRVIRTLSHHLAHQFVGSSLEWKDRWLTEVVAEQIAEKATLSTWPERARLAHFERLSQRVLLLRRESGEGGGCSLAGQLAGQLSGVSDSDEIQRSILGNSCVHLKGAALFGMLESLVGSPAHDYALRKLVQRVAATNGSLTVEDLWTAWPRRVDHSDQDDHSPVQVLTPWIEQRGLPEITVTRHYESSAIRVGQRKARVNLHRVFLEGASTAARREVVEDEVEESWAITEQRVARPPPPIDRRPRNTNFTLWPLPFSYSFGGSQAPATQTQVTRQFWLRAQRVVFADPEVWRDEPLIADSNWTRLYRVNYDAPNWRLLAKRLHSHPDGIPMLARIRLAVDADHFLSQSAAPHLYLSMLGRLLAHERRVEPLLLLGVDALHRLLDENRGTPAAAHALVHFARPIVQRVEQHALIDVQQRREPVTAAMWLIEPSRLVKFYQLRCALQMTGCYAQDKIERWLESSGKTSNGTVATDEEESHQLSVAICHYLFTKSDERAVDAVRSRLLLSRGAAWMRAVQFAACSQDTQLAQLAARQAVEARNAALLVALIRDELSLHYNLEFRQSLWKEVGAALSGAERRLLFGLDALDGRELTSFDWSLTASSSSSHPHPGVALIHAVRGMDELRWLRALLPSWGARLSAHVDYVERELKWRRDSAAPAYRAFVLRPGTNGGDRLQAAATRDKRRRRIRRKKTYT